MDKYSVMPLFSVIVPVYNKEPHVKRAIKSILNQTFKDFELIVVCDPSTDKSSQVVESIKDERIVNLYRDSPGPGGYAARNKGILHATGRVICFLDADDYWNPDHLEKIASLKAEFPSANIFSCAWSVFDGKTKSLNLFSLKEERKFCWISYPAFLQAEIEGASPIWTSVAAVSRDLIISAGLFPEGKITMGGDVDTWLRCIEKASGLAWSNHIGAVYCTDSVNMVTKSSHIDPRLHVETANNLKLSADCEATKKLLGMRANKYVAYAWYSNFNFSDKENFDLSSYISWDVATTKLRFAVLVDKLPMSIKTFALKLAVFLRRFF
ncbi:MAG: glycosyltransferase family 2 protein [Alkalibacterium sp.]|nr:glycosyltransferase family 2 protein [Alkalibacterium sp.]